jgi:hypothetical protein
MPKRPEQPIGEEDNIEGGGRWKIKGGGGIRRRRREGGGGVPLFVLSVAANEPGPPLLQKAIGAEAEGTSCGSAIQTNVECWDFCMGLVYVTYPENIFQGGSGDRPGRDLRGVRGRKRVGHLFDAALTRGGVSLQEKADD